MKLNKLTDIIPLIEQGMTYAEIGKKLKPQRSAKTIEAYVARMRKAGHTIATKRGGHNKLKV